MNVQSVTRRVLNAKYAAATALVLGTGFAQASNLDFELFNSTNQPIVAMWVSRNDDSIWRAVSDTFVPESGSQRVHFTTGGNGACYFDLRVQFSEGQARYWRNINLCSVSRFRVYVQGGEVKGWTS